MAQPRRRRTLGDKLFVLGQLSRDELLHIEILVDYRIAVCMHEEFERIKAASKTLRLVERR